MDEDAWEEPWIITAFLVESIFLVLVSEICLLIATFKEQVKGCWIFLVGLYKELGKSKGYNIWIFRRTLSIT